MQRRCRPPALLCSPLRPAVAARYCYYYGALALRLRTDRAAAAPPPHQQAAARSSHCQAPPPQPVPCLPLVLN